MTTRSAYIPPETGRLAFWNDATFEQVFEMAGCRFYDDFIGAGSVAIPTQGSPIAGYPWIKRLVGAGSPTAGGVANAGCGIVSLVLTATSEKQEASFYHNDQLNIDPTRGLVFETAVTVPVLPSAAGVQFVAGLSSAWIDGPDNAAKYLEFGSTANGTVNIRSQDGVVQRSVASGMTFLTTGQHVLRIDCHDAPTIKFYIDGNGVGSLNFAATGAGAVMQPYFSVYKPAGTGVATLNIDYARCSSRR